jgi:hypothetical protein
MIHPLPTVLAKIAASEDALKDKVNPIEEWEIHGVAFEAQCDQEETLSDAEAKHSRSLLRDAFDSPFLEEEEQAYAKEVVLANLPRKEAEAIATKLGIPLPPWFTFREALCKP